MFSFGTLSKGFEYPSSIPATMNISLTAPHTSRSLPIPPPNEEEIFSAVSESSPISSKKAKTTD